jgi:hypothetical protein
MPLGNTCAALTELSYYGRPRTVFQAKYHDREPPVHDAGPPFSRTVLLPLPDESDEVAAAEAVDLCSQMLYRDLATPLGRAADLARAGLPSPPWEERGQYYQTFGLFQLAWPRHSLLQGAARGLVQRVVARWMSKDSKPLREAVQEWVQEQWARRQLGADAFIERTRDEMGKRLRGGPEALFAAAIEPLTKVSAHGDANRKGSRELKGLAPEALAAVLTELEALIGRPADDHPPEEPPRLLPLLRQATDKLAERWGQQIAELSVHLIEAPKFRLAGAEEAIRQVVTTIEQALQHHEPLAKELTQKAREAYECLNAYARPKPGARRPALGTAELIELARAYAKWHYQSLILTHLSSSFVSLRGHLSDELREVNFCRVRLGELLRLLETPPGRDSLLGPAGGRKWGIGKRLYFAGCRNQREAVEHLLEGVTPEHLLDLDGRIEEMLKAQFTALVHVCMTTQNILKDVEAALLRVASDFAAELLPPTTAADLFFEQHPEAEAAEGEVARYFDEAAPELSAGRNPRPGPPVAEVALVTTPDGPAGEAFRELLQQSMGEGAELHNAGSPDDVLIYRERNNLPLAGLEQLGPVARDAYAQMTATENFTPHSRCDVDFKGR